MYASMSCGWESSSDSGLDGRKGSSRKKGLGTVSGWWVVGGVASVRCCVALGMPFVELGGTGARLSGSFNWA